MKKIVILLFLVCFFLFPIKKTFAQDPNFDISINSNYDINENGITTLTQKISIRNKSDYFFTPTYSVSVGFKDIQNIVAYGENGSIPFTLDDSDKENKNIKLKFEKRYAGLNVTNNFTLRFETKDVFSKKGNIKEIVIPGISSPDDFFQYNNIITVPKSFGEVSIVKPYKKQLNSGSLTFNKDEIGKSGIFLIFGEAQYYSFELHYHISNPNLFPVKTEIALPPTTSSQNVLISSFSQKPTNVILDSDKNWIAQYSLFPQQKMNVVVKGFVEVLGKSSNEKLTLAESKSLLDQRNYWEVNNNSILKIASEIKNGRDVYDYVAKKLTYNFSKVTGDNRRLGAIGSLKNPDNSVCLEFTDLFVTLARAAGIPARAVEGYAYTENSALRPLSLVEDVLHSWPEYYDKDLQKWVMVDPTWGNTTKGLDYFNSLDFEHIIFVRKGKDSQYPIPAGGYKFDKRSKDVSVNFADRKDFKEIDDIEITDDFPNFIFPGSMIEGNILIKNNGNSIINKRKVIISSSENKIQEFMIDAIPPGGFKTFNLKLENTSFLTKGQKILKIQIGKFEHTKKIKISFIPDLSLLLFFGGILIGAIAVTIITYNTGSILIQRRKRENTLRGKSKKY